MTDIRSLDHPSDNVEKKGTATIKNSLIDGKEAGSSNAIFEDVEAHIRYKDFKTRQVCGQCRAWDQSKKTHN